MGVVVELRKVSRDGSVRLLHPRSAEERAGLIALAHIARCQAGMSYRAVARALEQAGARVGRMTAWRYVNTGPPCDWCRRPDVTAMTRSADG